MTILTAELAAIAAGQPNASADVRSALSKLESIGVQIGMSLPWDGTGDPAGGRFLLRDGRLIDKTTYADYFNAVGHAFNGGVDPGSNKVRIGDARGRVIVGADNMGSAQGAASRIVAATRGANGGAVSNSHSHTVNAHSHSSVSPISDRNTATRIIDPAYDPSLFAYAGDGKSGRGVSGNVQTTGNTTAFDSIPSNNDLVGTYLISSSNESPGTDSQAVSTLQPYECSNYVTRVA